jgi:SAM-dependent methyltransferase
MAHEFPLTEIHGIDKVIPTRRRRTKTGDSMPGSPTSPLFSATRKVDHPSSMPSSPSLGPETTFDYTGQPMDSPVPSNCFFHKADISMGLPFPDNTFDYCHVRLVLWGYPLNSFPDLLNELIRVTKTGGWIEFVDMDPCILKATETGACINEWVRWRLH